MKRINKLKVKVLSRKIGSTLIAATMIATPAIASFTQAQPVANKKAKSKAKVKKSKTKKKKSYRAKAGTVNLKAITLTKGKSKTISVKSKSKVTWKTSNKSVVSVKSISKSKVKITAKKAGSANVTGKAKSAKWNVKVKVKGNKKPTPKPTGTSSKKSKTNAVKKKTNESQESSKNDTQKANTALLDNNIKAILHECGADAGTSDIQKFARLCHWWSLNVKYGENYPANAKDTLFKKYGTDSYGFSGSAAYITDYKTGVCGTQAEAFKYYCDLLGLKSKCIVGKGDNHEWLHIYLDDGWYTFDPTDFETSPCLTYEEYLNTNDGKSDYQFWFNAAFKHGTTKGNNEAAAEWANNKTFEEFKDETHYTTYHVANTCSALANHGNIDGNGRRSGPYYIDNDSIYEPISDSACNGELNGQKYINALLYEYL